MRVRPAPWLRGGTFGASFAVISKPDELVRESSGSESGPISSVNESIRMMLRVAFTVSSAAPPRSVMPSAGQSTMLHTRPIPAPGALSMSWKQSPPRTSDGSANGHASAVCELHARTHLPDRSWLSKPPGVPPIATSSSSSSSTFCRLSALCFCATAAASRRLQSLRRCSVCSLLLRPVPLTRPPSHCPSPPASPARGKFLSEAPKHADNASRLCPYWAYARPAARGLQRLALGPQLRRRSI